MLSRNIIKVYVFFILLLALSIAIFADTLTTFTNGLTSCNVTSNDSTTCAINLTDYTGVSSATMNISGIATSIVEVYNSFISEKPDGTSLPVIFCGGYNTVSLGYDGYLLITNSSTGNIFKIGLLMGEDVGEPENENFVVDIKICETDIIDFLSTSGYNPVDNCSSNYTIVANDYNLSSWGSVSSGEYRNITFDSTYYISDDKKYIIFFDFINQTATTSFARYTILINKSTDKYLMGYNHPSTGWKVSGGLSSTGAIADFKLYQDETYPSSPSISISDSVIWNQSGIFSSTETTSDFSSSLTAGVVNYLNISASVWGELSLDALNITTITDTCTYSGSGDWAINISDNCTLSTDTNIYPNIFSVFGDDGILTINASISAKEIHKIPDDFDGGYIIRIMSGASLAAVKS